MAVTRMWKVYGADGHRQRESFNESYDWNFSKDGKTRLISVCNSDKTGTNDYSVVIITRDTADECERELYGQISDGIFENSRTGKIEEIYKNKNMKDLVTAVYFKDCYAGETVLRLEKVFYCEEIPDKYQTYEYEIKLMSLVEYFAGGDNSDS